MGLKIHGMAQLRQELADIAELHGGEIGKKMLKEGTKVVADTWRRISFERHILTGNMYKAVESSNPKKNQYGRYTVTYPRDYEERTRKGKLVKVRNAEKAFYNHYGFYNVLFEKYIQGDHWVDDVDNIAEPKSDEKMQKVLDDFIKTVQKGK